MNRLLPRPALSVAGSLALCLAAKSSRHQANSDTSSTSVDVVVIGGGIIGSSCALALARRHKKRTIVLEKGTVACEASGLSAGTVAVAGKPQSQTALEEEHWENYVCRWSRQLLLELEEEHGRDIERVTPCGGSLELIISADQLAWAKKIVAEERAHGLECYFLDAEQLHTVEPALGPNDGRFLGAVHLPLSIGVDSARATHAIASVAEESGAQVWEHASVTAIDRVMDDQGQYVVHTSDGRRVAARNVVIAAGARANEIGRMLNVDIPVVPVKGQMFSVDWDDLPPEHANSIGGWNLRHIIYSAEGPHWWDTHSTFDRAAGVPRGITHVPANIGERKGGEEAGDSKAWRRVVHHLYGRPIQGGRRVMLGGSRLLDGFDENVDVPALEQTRAYACKFIPALEFVDNEGYWGGLMPFSMAEDGNPMVGSLADVGHPGVYVAVGFGAEGIMQGPAGGNLVADMVALEGTPAGCGHRDSITGPLKPTRPGAITARR